MAFQPSALSDDAAATAPAPSRGYLWLGLGAMLWVAVGVGRRPTGRRNPMRQSDAATLADAIIERLPVFWNWGPATSARDLYEFESPLATAHRAVWKESEDGCCACGCGRPVAPYCGRGRIPQFATKRCADVLKNRLLRERK